MGVAVSEVGGDGRSTSAWVLMMIGGLLDPGPCSLWASTRTLYTVPGCRPLSTIVCTTLHNSNSNKKKENGTYD